jgi:hypothetical protein
MEWAQTLFFVILQVSPLHRTGLCTFAILLIIKFEWFHRLVLSLLLSGAVQMERRMAQKMILVQTRFSIILWVSLFMRRRHYSWLTMGITRLGKFLQTDLSRRWPVAARTEELGG